MRCKKLKIIFLSKGVECSEVYSQRLTLSCFVFLITLYVLELDRACTVQLTVVHYACSVFTHSLYLHLFTLLSWPMMALEFVTLIPGSFNLCLLPHNRKTL